MRYSIYHQVPGGGAAPFRPWGRWTLGDAPCHGEAMAPSSIEIYNQKGKRINGASTHSHGDLFLSVPPLFRVRSVHFHPVRFTP